ncbi:MAG: hypothetical protein Q4F49_07915 [Pseudoxanthomonas suwonensis]|nr:hypothetical protein [Pseudoxanthomonas suwonensis]
MHARRTTRPLHALRRSALTLAIGGALLMAAPAAMAADPACLVWDAAANGGQGGYVPAPTAGTNQGQEHGFENTTCHTTASAYGFRNNASGSGSSAFG